MFKKVMRAIFPSRSNGAAILDAQQLKMLVRAVMTTRPDEIGCDECYEKLDRFVEIELADKDAAEAMPLVQDHLQRCRECREEFEALLGALRAIA